MVERLSYRKNTPWNCPSNRVRKVRVPTGLRLLPIRKKGGIPKCGDCKKMLCGVSHARSAQWNKLPRASKSVSRVYGGSRCGACVRTRILKAFLMDERQCVRMMQLEKLRADRGGKDTKSIPAASKAGTAASTKKKEKSNSSTSKK